MISFASTSRLPLLISKRTPTLLTIRSFSKSKRNNTKIETVLFACDETTAKERLETAAASAFGLMTVVKLLLYRFSRPLGFQMENPLELKAIKPMLLPYFKVDLSMRGQITVGESVMDISVTALDATVPAFKLSPLDQLNVDSLTGEVPVPFDPTVHLNQYSQSISLLPFSQSPLRTLKKLASYPRTINDKFSVST